MSGMNLQSVLYRNDHIKKDAALLERIVNGDEEALAQLYDQYSAILFGLIRTIVNNREIAEDLLQEIFLLIWDRSDRFDASKGSVYTWMVTLARNKAIDRIRSKSYRLQLQNVSTDQVEPLFTPASSEPSPYESMLNDENAEIIKDALNNISAKQREVIEIAYFEGLSQSKIAETYNIPLGTVKTRMRQGLDKLHTLLKNKEGLLR
jgi:RNA polymerase sigma-70 factor, ECF subfamily